MRKLVLTLAFAGVALAQGGNPFITLTENGYGFLLFPGGSPIVTHGVLAVDPGPGGLPSALTYNLLGPPGLVAGDLHINEIQGVVGSDIIRFNPAGTGTPGYPGKRGFLFRPGRPYPAVGGYRIPKRFVHQYRQPAGNRVSGWEQRRYLHAHRVAARIRSRILCDLQHHQRRTGTIGVRVGRYCDAGSACQDEAQRSTEARRLTGRLQSTTSTVRRSASTAWGLISTAIFTRLRERCTQIERGKARSDPELPRCC